MDKSKSLKQHSLPTMIHGKPNRLLVMLMAPAMLQSTSATNANNPSIRSCVRSRPIMGMRRFINRKWESSKFSEGVVSNEEGGFTRGDLDEIILRHQREDSQSNHDNNLFHASGSCSEKEPPMPPSQLSRNLRTHHHHHLQRIHLDLSGRIMSHILSPSSNHCVERESVPLLTVPLNKSSLLTEKEEERQHQVKFRNTNLQRFIPHLYVGAYYDLDEVWYGATRWITKCSWGPLNVPGNRNSISKTIKTNSMLIQEGDYAKSPTTLRMNQAWQNVKSISLLSLFPFSKSSTTSSWVIDLEGEQSVVDRTDSTCRIRLIQSQQSTSNTNNDVQRRAAIFFPRLISLEYDSAKYNTDVSSPYAKRHLQYSPTLSMNLQTPFLHRRIELHTKKTWIIKEGGDKYGNYYGGEYFNSESNAADRRFNYIKERYRDGIPKSMPIRSLTTSQARTNCLRSKLSNWLENDGWMPRKVTMNLMGNLVSVSEFGLKDHETKYPADDDEEEEKASSSAPDTKIVGASVTSQQRSRLENIIPLIHNAGIRIRVSKKIDWTTVGIFPWSNNNASFQSHNNIYNTNNSRGWRETLQSTLIRIELCGLFGREEEMCASVGLEVDPLDWSGTYKFTIGQESATIVDN